MDTNKSKKRINTKTIMNKNNQINKSMSKNKTIHELNLSAYSNPPFKHKNHHFSMFNNVSAHKKIYSNSFIPSFLYLPRNRIYPNMLIAPQNNSLPYSLNPINKDSKHYEIQSTQNPTYSRNGDTSSFKPILNPNIYQSNNKNHSKFAYDIINPESMRELHKNKVLGLNEIKMQDTIEKKILFKPALKLPEDIPSPLNLQSGFIFEKNHLQTSVQNSLKKRSFKRFLKDNHLKNQHFEKNTKRSELINKKIKKTKKDRNKDLMNTFNIAKNKNVEITIICKNNHHSKKNDELRVMLLSEIQTLQNKFDSIVDISVKELSDLNLENEDKTKNLKDELKIFNPMKKRKLNPMIENIVQNSFLNDNKNHNYLFQLENTINKTINYLRNNNEIIYHKENIFTIINLQIPLCNLKFKKLSKSTQLRVLCMLFAKYINRKAFIKNCSSFINEINFKNEKSILSTLFNGKSKNKDTSGYDYKNELLIYFLESNSNNKRIQSINYKHAILFLKKIIIYILTLMKMVRDFIYIKSEKGELAHDQHQMANLIRLSNHSSQDSFRNKIIIDETLCSLSIDALLSRFDITDFYTYLILGHTYIKKKERQVRVKLKHNDTLYSFIMTSREQRDLLCFKIKRKDELIKFSFKYIRRQIFKEFREKHKRRFEEPDRNKLKQIFFNQYFKGDKEAITYFESFDLSRKGLEILRGYSDLKEMMCSFQEGKYIKSLVHEYIFDKSDDILKEHLGFQGFVKEVLSRQHKHSVVVQGVLNSLDQFIQFFQV